MASGKDRFLPEAFAANDRAAPRQNDGSAQNPCATCAGNADSGSQKKSVQARAAEIAARCRPLRVVFMGTPDFAAIILERLLRAPQIRVAAVYTQPDRPAGRGQKPLPPPVKILAASRNLPVFQPSDFKNNPEGDMAVATLGELEPDVLAVAAYGLILPRRVLDIPKIMPINVHASLLPKYRGAAPIQRAIMAGDTVTGVTVMRIEQALDAGPILMQRAVGIGINDTSGILHDELAREGGELLVQALERLGAGALAPMPQNNALATYASKIDKAEGALDFSLPPAALHAKIRGLTPKPGAFVYLHRQGHDPLKVQVGPGIFPLPPAMRKLADAGCGTVDCERGGKAPVPIVTENALLLKTGGDYYAFSQLKPAGKNFMDGTAFYNGYLKGFSGACFIGSRNYSPFLTV